MKRLLYPVDEAELMRIEKETNEFNYNHNIPAHYLLIRADSLSRIIDQLRDEWDNPPEPSNYPIRCDEMEEVMS